MKLFCRLLILMVCFSTAAQEKELPNFDFSILSSSIKSPLYQQFNTNEFDLLVYNINVFDDSKTIEDFDFLYASAQKESKYNYPNYYQALERQMNQFRDFKIEINNSQSSPLIDYHDQPLYLGSNRLKNSAYQNADRLTGAQRGYPLLYSPFLRSRRGLFWY